MSNPIEGFSVAHRSVHRGKIPVPAPGYCVVRIDELRSEGGLLLASASVRDSDPTPSVGQANAFHYVLVATSGCVPLADGRTLEHPAKAGDTVFLRAAGPDHRAGAAAGEHPMIASGHYVFALSSVVAYIDNQPKATANA